MKQGLVVAMVQLKDLKDKHLDSIVIKWCLYTADIALPQRLKL